MGSSPRCIVFIDGFNLYHAIISHPPFKERYKWIDLRQLAQQYVQEPTKLIRVIYFTAYATWRPDSRRRHKFYVSALQSVGVETILGQFREKDRFVRVQVQLGHNTADPRCRHEYRGWYLSHEEKHTDVSIAIELLKGAMKDRYDRAIIISGDSDLVPAIKAVHAVSDKKVGVVIPIGRKAKELIRAADFHHNMGAGAIRRCQLPSKITLKDGRVLEKPAGW